MNDEDGDTNKECWNSAVGYCIGALRTMQEQLPAVRPTTEGIGEQWAEVAIAMLNELRLDYAPGVLKDTDGVKAIQRLREKLSTVAPSRKRLVYNKATRKIDLVDKGGIVHREFDPPEEIG